ncbi:MAG: helix-turn-helix domain-containing protein, partial [Pseudomonadota bacterium]
DKWTLLIIRDLMFEGKQSYSELLNSRENISTNILASRLKSMQETGIIVASTAKRGQAGSGYALTQKGIDMIPIMLEVYLWTEKHYSIPKDIQTILEVVKADKSAFIDKIAADLTDKLKMSA